MRKRKAAQRGQAVVTTQILPASFGAQRRAAKLRVDKIGAAIPTDDPFGSLVHAQWAFEWAVELARMQCAERPEPTAVVDFCTYVTLLSEHSSRLGERELETVNRSAGEPHKFGPACEASALATMWSFAQMVEAATQWPISEMLMEAGLYASAPFEHVKRLQYFDPLPLAVAGDGRMPNADARLVAWCTRSMGGIAILLTGFPQWTRDQIRRDARALKFHAQSELSRAQHQATALVTVSSVAIALAPGQPAVDLRGAAQSPLVFGREVAVMSKATYRVVEAILKAGPDGLSLKDLLKVKGDARTYLRTLRKSDALWWDAIIPAGQRGRNYAIRHG